MNPKRITYNTHVGNTANDFGGLNLLCTHALHMPNVYRPTPTIALPAHFSSLHNNDTNSIDSS
jgi:hypothetical protein